MGLNPMYALCIPRVSPGRPRHTLSPIQRMFSLYPFSFHRLPHSFALMGPRNSFPINHFRILSHAIEGGGMNPLFPRVTSHESRVTILQICPFNLNNFHDCSYRNPFLFMLLHCCRGVGRAILILGHLIDAFTTREGLRASRRSSRRWLPRSRGVCRPVKGWPSPRTACFPEERLSRGPGDQC